MDILVRVAGDIVVKSDRVRARFIQRLHENLAVGLRRAEARGRVERGWSRLMVRDAGPEASEVLRRTFGIGSFSPIAAQSSASFDEIVAAGAEAFSASVHGKRFAVRARRAGSHAFTSMDVAKELGSRLWSAGGKVDLTTPEYEVFVEIRGDKAYLFDQVNLGLGGLPVGVGGRAIALMSGGFDSVVAAWRMQRRGIATDYLFCNLAGSAHETSVLKVARVLWEGYGHGTKPRLYSVDFTKIADAIRQNIKPSHNQVILKRMFYRVAEQIAQKRKIDALITGECVGQVSSQTLTNLVTISEAIRTPVFRPLISYDKDEIIKIARRIGTFAVSAGVTEYCQLVPDKPVTACTLRSAHRQEVQLRDIDTLVAESVASLTEHDVASFDPMDTQSVFVEAIPSGAQLLDCRDEMEVTDDPIEGTQHTPPHHIDTYAQKLPKQGTYLLFCGLGYQSAMAAEKLQRKGFEAYSLRGGTVRLKKLLAGEFAASKQKETNLQ